MKRTISLLIAIAVMVSMFVLPASAAEEYVVDMTTIPNTGSFPAAGINDVVGLHFESGGTPDGRLSVFPLDLSGYNTMTITYRTGPEATTGVECATMRLRKSDYSATIGSFSIKGSGGWSVEAEASIDISAVTEGTTNYLFNLDTCNNGFWITGIKLTGEGTGSTDPVTPPASGTVTTLDGIVAGNSTLGADISGIKSISSGTYVIDLAGYKWTGRLLISGTADVTIMDSSVGKTGLIDASQMGDAIDVSGSAKLTLDAVKVIGAVNEGDAIFVSGGTVVSNNSILTAGKAGIDVTSASASVTVNGGSFPEFTYGAKNERNSAIELRWNAKVTLNGDIDFIVNRIVARKTQDGAACHTNAIADSIVCGANASATFTAETAVVDPYPNYNVTEITYTYTTVTGDPAFVDGAKAISLTAGLTINFLAENITANESVFVDGVEVRGEYKVDGEYAGYTVFAFGGFGPQEMGDDFTAELYSDGVLVDTVAYSVKDYCDEAIANAESSDELVALAKAVLNYGAAAQNHMNYKKDALVNDSLSEPDKDVDSKYYDDVEVITHMSGNITDTYDWASANVYFADKLTLVLSFKANEKTISEPSYVVGAEDVLNTETYKEYDVIEKEDGVYEFRVSDILPTQFKTGFSFYAVDAAGTQLMRTLLFSVGAYAEMTDNYNTDEYGEYVEPNTTINGLVKALMVYGDAAVAFVASV